MRHIYLLKDLAKKSGCSVHTLKYYLKLGLLREMGRSPETNYRYFDDNSFDQLQEILKMREQRMSLKDIKGSLEREGRV